MILILNGNTQKYDMKRIALYSGMAAVLVASCSIQEEDFKTPEQEDDVFYASFEEPSEGTKVYANEDLLLRWTSDDRVSIFNKNTFNQEYRFNGETGDNSGSFKKIDNGDFVTGNAISHVVSVYPYQAITKISESESITIDLPAEQHYAENSFGLGANTMVSVTADNFLQYKNVGGYLMLKLYGEGVSVSSITLKGNNGEKLAGNATVTMQQDGVPTAAMANDATAEITLTCESPVQLGASANESTQFWFVVPPVTFTNGFTIIVRDNKNGIFEKSTTKTVTINRNKLTKLSAIYTDCISQEVSQPLTLEAIENGSVYISNPIGLKIEYCINGTEWISSETSFSVDLSAGQSVQFRGDNETYTSNYFTADKKVTLFDPQMPCYIYGNIMSLIDSKYFSTKKEISGYAAFAELFDGNENLYNHSDKELLLPASSLSDYCYSALFQGCSKLTTAPDLPAMELAEGCYSLMFSGCANLVNVPKLPATNLTEGCYYNMFSYCASLETTPELHATVLKRDCYWGMFSNCSALKFTPNLPATELAESCYQSMFAYCSNLETVPTILPATKLARYCYKRMFRGCPKIQTAPVLPAEVLERYAYQEMFSGCSMLSFIKALFLGPGGALEGWVEGVADSGTFIMNENSTWNERGVNAIPEGWQVFKEGSSSGLSVLTYMSHTKGSKSVPLIILPDGFVKEELSTFRSRAINAVEALFSVEPYKTYRDYFSVYIIEIPSEESGASITDGQGNIITSVNTYFETRWGASSYSDMRANEAKIHQIASLCPDILNGDHDLRSVPIALLVNDTRYGGICISDSNGYAYSIIPYSYSGETISWSYPATESVSNVDDSQGYRTVPSSEISEMGVSYGNWLNIFVHEFGGHAFGRLADEYWYGSNSASSSSVLDLEHSFSVPFGLNVSGSYYMVPWQELLDNQQQLVPMDAHYERIGIYQGGDVCMFGRWRNERISCMIDNRFYFSAWQRFLIAKRIMTISGDIDSFSFESWLAQDKTDDPLRDNISSSIRSYAAEGNVHFEKPLLPPTLIER